VVSSAIAHERLRDWEGFGGLVFRLEVCGTGETRASDLEFEFLALEKFIGLGSEQSRPLL
jgi:hypothetical protein